MRDFTRLFHRLDRTTKTGEKLRALADYFDVAEPRDAAWALFMLTGRTLPRAVSTRLLREAAAEAAGLPLWLVEESYDHVGDLAETAALLHPGRESSCSLPLHVLVEEVLRPMREMDEEEKKTRLREIWSEMDPDQRFLWNKFITGGFRVGVSRGLVARALAERAGVDPAVIAHRLMGDWQPNADFMETVVQGSGSEDPGKPYPFYLASPLEHPPEALGTRTAWQVEWKWDGIRAQLIRRGDHFMLWSRGEELITDRFPEVIEAAGSLPDGTVLDGEILAWRDDRPMPFFDLQRRIGRKTVGKKLRVEVPVTFMAFDVMERGGEDIRSTPLSARRSFLDTLIPSAPDEGLRVSPLLEAETWRELADLRDTSRERGVEGCMLKRRDSVYKAGRTRGDWWKWKVDPYEIDAVLTYARKGHGRRAGLYTDYTFGLWSGGELVTFAKAYSGLTDAEIREVDRFVRANTIARFGPVRQVKPELVFQVACDDIRLSPRHKSGVAVRFPRMARRRRDKCPEEADSLESVKRLIPGQGSSGKSASRSDQSAEDNRSR